MVFWSNVIDFMRICDSKGKLRGIWPGGGVPALWGVPALGGCACSRGAGDPPVTATAAGSTHPTRMYYCFQEELCGILVKCDRLHANM